jgi:hypothetical protein
MLCEIKDNIMRQVYHNRKSFVDTYELSPEYKPEDVKTAISDLLNLGLITKEDSKLKITSQGETFCLTSSFCVESKPIVEA